MELESLTSISINLFLKPRPRYFSLQKFGIQDKTFIQPYNYLYNKLYLKFIHEKWECIFPGDDENYPKEYDKNIIENMARFKLYLQTSNFLHPSFPSLFFVQQKPMWVIIEVSQVQVMQNAHCNWRIGFGSM